MDEWAPERLSQKIHRCIPAASLRAPRDWIFGILMVFKLERRDRFPGHKQEDQGGEEAQNPDMRVVRDVHRAALCHDDAHTDSHSEHNAKSFFFSFFTLKLKTY